MTVLFVLMAFSDTYAEWAFKNKIGNIREDNKKLQKIIQNQEIRLQGLYENLDSVKEQGEVFRNAWEG